MATIELSIEEYTLPEYCTVVTPEMGTEVSFYVLKITISFSPPSIVSFLDSSALSKTYLFDSNQVLMSVPIPTVLYKIYLLFSLLYYSPNSLNGDSFELLWKGFTVNLLSDKTEL